jgi:phosphatidate cytidylyltransferase
MSDEQWRRRERETRDPSEEFGGPLFPDEDPETATDRPDDTGERRLRFGPNDTGPLPHWTDPPTGEVPRVAPASSAADEDDDEDVDVWSSFTTESPIWRDDLEEDASGGVARDPSGSVPRDPSGSVPRDPSGSVPRDPSGDLTGEVRTDALSEPISRRTSGEVPTTPPPRREPGRITIGTDPSGIERRRPPAGGRRRGTAAQTRSGRPAGPARTSASQPPPPRNLPAAIGAGLILAAVFVAMILWRPAGVTALITVVLAIAAFEYFGKVTEKGYRPAVAPGLAACVAAPLVAYWVGDGGLPLVVAFAFMAGAIGFIGAHGVEAGPLPNMAVTTMGVVWIGLLGSFAALIVRWSNTIGEHVGTDTLFAIVLGVVANDIGALAVGSSIGRTPLRRWISPGKTVEGLIGGTILTFLVLIVLGLTGRSDTWSTGELLLLGLVIVVMAPLGDLTESMFKRNLDVKDFGSLVSGHGGVLDRFDAFLFVLPVAYYVTWVLEPWAS